MNPQNIDRLLVFQTAGGNVLTLQALRRRYGLAPAGTNFYYGINQENCDLFATTGSPLNPTHVSFFDGIMASLRTGTADEVTVVLGVEPPSTATTYNYAFVSAHTNVVRALAAALAGMQAQAAAENKRLAISIRYASEMNDRGEPEQFKASFAEVRQIFRDAAPGTLFSFSPAIRADVDISKIPEYWPGNDLVDIIGGTWYIHGQVQQAKSTANLRDYVLHSAGADKPFALDEVGGANAAATNNDEMLQFMLHQMAALSAQHVAFQYATIFLASDLWGKQATLAFLDSSEPLPPSPEAFA